MKKMMMFLMCLSFFLCGTALTAQAVLVDHGSSGQYFYDTSTGLYWWDPAQFVEKTKDEIDAFVNSNPNWKYATAFEVDALLGKTSGNDTPLNQIMGAQQFDTSLYVNDVLQTGHRWIGFFDKSAGLPPGTVGDPDGWLAQTVLEPVADLTTIGDTGFQNNVEEWKRGAWINSRINPAPEVWSSAYDVMFDTQTDLTLLRGYRDEFLTKSIKGKLYTTLLYQSSEEALKVLLKHPRLMRRANKLIRTHKWAVENVLNGTEGVIKNTNAVMSFLRAYGKKSPPALRFLTKEVIREMRKQQRRGRPFLGFRLE